MIGQIVLLPRLNPEAFVPARTRHCSALLLVACLVGQLTTACAPTDNPAPTAAAGVATSATFVGSDRCAACHVDQMTAWTGSQHQLAMQPATRYSVLAPFAGETFASFGVTSTFLERDDGLIISTEGADGRPADFAIKYTFGIFPLQQYLIALPGGRLQAFGLAWDTRPGPEGGQRWFDLTPDQRHPAGDPLHWTGYQQNWNFMCADCHSTNVRKNFDAQADTFNTTWSEISVGCEACHGPGSAHLQWASQARPSDSGAGNKGLPLLLDERRGVTWSRDETGHPTRSAARETAREIEVCARCHSRRSQLTDQVTAADPLAQGFQVALIDQGLYFPDGQMRDEVYNYASFLQSRMHASGVTCSDCHDPHTQKLRAPGDAVCAQCHDAGTFATTAHHFHPDDTRGARCIGCHMPTQTYMQADRRHDHSFRIPQPAVSAAAGAPVVCLACHPGKGSAWAEAVIASHYPQRKKPFQTFGAAFAGLERGAAGATQQVLAIASDPTQPPIVRASALRRLAHAGANVPESLLATASRDFDVLLRSTAAELAAEDESILTPLLGDPLRAVRLNAVLGLAPRDGIWLQSNAEYLASLRYNADRPEAQTSLGNALFRQGDVPGALWAFQEALARDPGYTAAYLSLADRYRELGDEPGAERTLRDAALHGRDDLATVQFSLGLALVRQRRYDEAVGSLADAVAREPETVQFVYTYAVALYELDRKPEAIDLVTRALSRRPDSARLQDLLETFLSEP